MNKFPTINTVQRGFECKMVPTEATKAAFIKNGMVIKDIFSDDIHRGVIMNERFSDIIKPLINDVLVECENEIMSAIDIEDIDAMYAAIKDNDKKKLNEINKKLRNIIRNILVTSVTYNTKLKSFKEFLKNCDSSVMTDKERELFNGHTTMYTSRFNVINSTIVDGINCGSIAYRTVENIEKFLNLIIKIETIDKDYSDFVEYADSFIAEPNGIDGIRSVFVLGNAKNVYRQDYIDKINDIISGFLLSTDNTVKIKGLCECLNEYGMKNGKTIKTITKKNRLHKQITSIEKIVETDRPNPIASDEEMVALLTEYNENISSGSDNDAVCFLIESIRKCCEDGEMIIVGNKMRGLSYEVYDDGFAIKNNLQTYALNNFKRKSDIKKFISDKTIHTTSECIDKTGVAVIIDTLNELKKKYQIACMEYMLTVKSLSVEDIMNNYVRTNQKVITVILRYFSAIADVLRYSRFFYSNEFEENDDIDTTIGSYGEFVKAYMLAHYEYLNSLLRSYFAKKPSSFANDIKVMDVDLQMNENKKESFNRDCLICRDKDGMVICVLPINNGSEKSAKIRLKGLLTTDGNEDSFEMVSINTMNLDNMKLSHLDEFNEKKVVDERGKRCIEYKKNKNDLTREQLNDLIDYTLSTLKRVYKQYADRIIVKDFSEYATYDDFLVDIAKYAKVFLRGIRISKAKLNELVECGAVACFNIVNRFNEENSYHNKYKGNRYARAFNAMFSDANLDNTTMRIIGCCVRYRERAIADINACYCHKKGSILLNKTTKDGYHIDDDIYMEIYEWLNKNRSYDSLSDDAKEFEATKNYSYSVAKHNIYKNKRYTEDSVIIKFSYEYGTVNNVDFDKNIEEHVKNNPCCISIDVGNVHPVTYTVLMKGEDGRIETVECGDFDVIDKYDFNGQYSNRLKDAKDARRNCKPCPKIKNNADGYVGMTVSKLVSLMRKYDFCPIVFENLNDKFAKHNVSRGSLWDKIIKGITKKLACLTFSDCADMDVCGLMNPMQLAKEDWDGKKGVMYTHNGLIYFVNPKYTSIEDPITNYRPCNDIFDKKMLSTEAVEKMSYIYYDNVFDEFVFGIRIGEGGFVSKALADGVYEIGTHGERIVGYKNANTVKPTELMKNVLSEHSIDYSDARDLISVIKDAKDVDLCDEICKIFKYCNKMRNSNVGHTIDYVISPVRDKNGVYYDTRKEIIKGIVNADLNGAYNIGRRFYDNDWNS